MARGAARPVPCRAQLGAALPAPRPARPATAEALRDLSMLVLQTLRFSGEILTKCSYQFSSIPRCLL